MQKKKKNKKKQKKPDKLSVLHPSHKKRKKTEMDGKLKGLPEIKLCKNLKITQISKKMSREARNIAKVLECLESLREKIVHFNTNQQTLITDIALLKATQEKDSKVISSLINEFESMNQALSLTNAFTGKLNKKEITKEQALGYLQNFPKVVQTMLFNNTTELKDLWYLSCLNLLINQMYYNL